MSERLLICAPQVEQRLELKNHLEALGHTVTMAPDLDACDMLLTRGEHALALVVHDPDTMDGLALLRRAGELKTDISVILLAVEGTIEDAVAAMQAGAQDFLCHPWTADVVGLAVQKGLNDMHLRQAAPKFSKESRAQDRHHLLTRSPLMERLLAQARSVAASRATVLIQGESGTGKELLARYIHRHSDRAGGPFVALNCAALPETLLESELFGHEKGAFSGAISRKLGRFELATGGTLLLDEITEMAMPLQAKLLRVLQEGEIDRLGGSTPVPVDVRVVATTNRDVLAAVRANQFREDLYFRLNVIPLKLPSLRERPEDIDFLAEHFREHFVQEYQKNGLGFANGVIQHLKTRTWSGNVRELKNIIERGVLLAQSGHIALADLLGEEAPEREAADTPAPPLAEGEVLKLGDLEREMVQRALSKTEGNRTHAARLLGISVRTLRNKLAEYRNLGIVL